MHCGIARGVPALLRMLCVFGKAAAIEHMPLEIVVV